MLVDDALRSVGGAAVWGAGDCVSLRGRPAVPRSGVTAVRQGPVLLRSLRAALGVGSHALVDATNLTPGDRRRFFSLAERLSAPVVAIRLTAPPATVRQRLRGAREGSSEAGFAVYERMRPRARPFAGRSVVVDTRYPLGPPLRRVAALLGESSP